MHPFEIAFFRSLFGMLLLAPWVLRLGATHLKTRRLALHAWRGVASVGALLAYFFAVTLIPLAEAAALTFTAPLFATACAGLVLAERVGWRRWSAVVAGFAGVLIILRPDVQVVSWPAMLVLVASVFVAAEILFTKALTSTESPETIVFYMGVLVTPFALVPAITVWVTPTLAQLGWLLALAAAATAGHIGVARAFRLVDATAVLPIDFTKLIFIASFGYLFFDEVPDALTWLGGVVIFSAAFYTAHREARRRVGARAEAR
jgi:drug/metabolite transporter (DMT)-like permease